MRIIKVVDLSVVIGAGSQVYPGDPTPRLTRHSTIEHDGFNLLSVEIGSQTGTHVDAPYHFDEGTERIDQVPLERVVGRGVIVDATGVGPRGVISWAQIEPVASSIEAGCIVLLHTGWSRHYGTDAYFDNPYLDAGACRELLARGVRTFGIDAINIDETPDSEHPGIGFPVHHLIAEAGGIICENLTGLAAIDFPEPQISLLPIALEAADGAPVRAVAIQFGE